MNPVLAEKIMDGLWHQPDPNVIKDMNDWVDKFRYDTNFQFNVSDFKKSMEELSNAAMKLQKAMEAAVELSWEDPAHWHHAKLRRIQ